MPRKSGRRTRPGAQSEDRARELFTRYKTLPVPFLLAVLNDERAPLALRCEMAKAAAPFVHHKLAPVAIGGADHPAEHGADLSKLSTEELVILERLMAKCQTFKPAKVAPLSGDHDESEVGS